MATDAGRDAGATPGRRAERCGRADAITPGQPYLEYIGDGELRLTYSPNRTIEVRLRVGRRLPVKPPLSVDELRAGGSLRSLNARTGDDGVASVTLLAGNVVAEFETVEAPTPRASSPSPFR